MADSGQNTSCTPLRLPSPSPGDSDMDLSSDSDPPNAGHASFRGSKNLRELDKLELTTQTGPREIQLLLGDITHLPVENKVDFVFTSAFLGDYTPVPTTLIGSLKRNLGVRVDNLAKNKAVDLRKNFSCWVSEPLEQHLPFRRLVCFEVKFIGPKLVDQISEMFRAMMPIFNNTEASIITPLLATGNQRHSMSKVMLSMVNAACEWMKAGLPLRCMKIVLFSPKPDHLSERDEKCMQLFSELKRKWAKIENLSMVAEVDPCDVCLSFTPEDRGLAEKIKTCLLEQRKDLRVHHEGFKFNQEDVWQEETFSVMKNSKKIIVVVTPAYVADLECLEQFSMALCCNRLQNAEVVSPFYLETVGSIPSYMSLVQYTECRVRKDGETFEGLLEAACVSTVRSLFQGNQPTEGDGVVETSLVERSRGTVYDIFISYSHQRTAEPVELYKILTKNHPDLNIFFDKSELKAGNLWQQALYEAVDRARCLVAFLSPGYVQSSVCNEEFNIALAKRFAHDSILFIPVHTDALETIPKRFSSLPCLDLAEGETAMQQLADRLVQLVLKCKANPIPPDPGVLKQKLQESRAADFVMRFKLDGGRVVMKITDSVDLEPGEVVFSFAQDCLHLAAIMCVMLKQHAPNLVGHLLASSHSQRRTHLDSANMVVIFISDQYISSQSLLEELHTVLCRQRTEKGRTIVYLVQCDHNLPQPFYLQALPFSVSLEDNLWRRLERASSNKNPRYVVDVDGMEGTYRCTAAQNLALSAAVYDVIHIMSQKVSTVPYNILNIARVENQMEGVADNHVSVHEHIVSLSAINHLMSKTYPAPSLNASTKYRQKQTSVYPKPSTTEPSEANIHPEAHIQAENESQENGRMTDTSSADRREDVWQNLAESYDLSGVRPVTSEQLKTEGSTTDINKVYTCETGLPLEHKRTSKTCFIL